MADRSVAGASVMEDRILWFVLGAVSGAVAWIFVHAGYFEWLIHP